jgi:hypothetical protein
MPVLLRAWPQLDALPGADRERLRARHADWQTDARGHRDDWVAYLLRDLLGWKEALAFRAGEEDDAGLDALTLEVPEHDARVRADFALTEPGTDLAAEPDAASAAKRVRLLGMVLPYGSVPTARVTTDDWAATPADRMARLCRHHGVQLGLVTDGRWWCLVWAPVGGVTTTALFDSVSWNEAADRNIVRAFLSLLNRRRFFEYAEPETLVGLLRESLAAGDEVTEALGIQVRQAVELLVDAIGRADARAMESGAPGLAASDVAASEVYRAAVAVMMRVVFLLFAEDRGLLPTDNEIYAKAYSARFLRDELKERAGDEGESALEHTTSAWHRLIALFHAVHGGIDHPELHLPAYDGSIFDPEKYAWMESTTPLLPIDDRTVLHMLSAVQEVQVGTGNKRETRTLSFRALDVEQIGYVYEGLLSFDGERATEDMVGLIGTAGLEHEVKLRELEKLAAESRDVKTLAKKIHERWKEPKPPASVSRLEKLLAPKDAKTETEARRQLAAVVRDQELVERLLPFSEIIRPDLRGLPTVIRSGSLYVTESSLRKNTGTHYTPRSLAQEVVHHALEPLVYEPGPLQTADEKQWVPKTAEQILSLKVADIAMGSAAFLVAACRYLGDRLIEAWDREGDQRAAAYRAAQAQEGEAHVEVAADAEQDPLVIEARRQIIEHCLYGVDINPMAVEMAKLSLWLVSMDPARPFTFLDDRLVAGDSLLGVANMRQLEHIHLQPGDSDDVLGWVASARERVARITREREEIIAIEGGDIEAVERKRALLAKVDEHAARLRLVGDLVVGAGLATCASGRVPWYESYGGERQGDFFPVAASIVADIVAEDVPDDSEKVRKARETAAEWLKFENPGGSVRVPLHWPLVFPEVFAGEVGGFDAIIGNPPFLGGQKLTGAMGDAYREYLVEYLAEGRRGSADLVAYFALRVHDLLKKSGHAGLVATNTLAQGDTREVGLDQLERCGVIIRRAVKSAPWPSRSAMLEYCAVWTSRIWNSPAAHFILGNSAVKAGITTSLNPGTRAASWSERLHFNAGISFIGSYVLGMGFTLSKEEAYAWISEDRRYAEVLFPYLNGDDVNQSPVHGTDRWVIDFQTWPIAKAEGYPKAFAKVLRDVKPERAKSGDRRRREIWWQFTRPAPEMRSAVALLQRCIVITRHSKFAMPVFVPTGQVFSEAMVVFATDDHAFLAVLSSALHYWWAVDRASTLETRVRYTPSDVFETLVRPQVDSRLRDLGLRLDSYRRDLMKRRNIGLTSTYNLVHDAECQDSEIGELRNLHREIDRATVAAYGWHDLLDDTGATVPADPTHETVPLDHGFHDTEQGPRYTIGLLARTEIIDRLRQLNHQAYADEVFLGLHKKPVDHPGMPGPSDEAKRIKAAGGVRKQAQSLPTAGDDDGMLF